MEEALRKSEKGVRLKSPKALAVSSHRLWTRAIPLFEFVVVAIAAYVASLAYHLLVHNNLSDPRIYIPFSLFVASLYFLICLIDDQYTLVGGKWKREGVRRAVGAIALAFAFFLSLVFLFDWQRFFSRGTFLTQLGVVSAAIVIARMVIGQQLEKAIQAGKLHGRGIIVVSLSADFRLLEYASKLCSPTDRIVHFFEINTKSSDKTRQSSTASVIRRIRNDCRAPGVDLIVLVYDAENQSIIENIVEALYELPVQIRLLPKGMIPFMRRSQVVSTGQFPTLEISTQPFSLLDRFLKRTFDLIIAIGAVVLLFPLLLLVAIAIKLDSRGPVLFRQIRHGFNNELIKVFKFRTMKVSKGEEPFRQATKDDPRSHKSWTHPEKDEYRRTASIIQCHKGLYVDRGATSTRNRP